MQHVLNTHRELRLTLSAALCCSRQQTSMALRTGVKLTTLLNCCAPLSGGASQSPLIHPSVPTDERSQAACRLQDLVNTALELEQYLASSTVAQQAAMGSAPTTLNGAPGQPDEADLLEEPRAPPMPQEPIIIQQRLKPECPLCLDSIEVLACGPCG